MEPASAASAIGGVANPKNKRFSLRTLYSPSPRPESIVASNRKTREGFATPGSSRYHESSSTVSTRSSSRGYSRRSSGSVLTKDTAATQSSDSGEDDVTDLLKGYISDGRIRLDAGEYKTAEDDFRKALSKMEAPRSRFSVDSTPSEIRLLLSEACLGQKKFDEATKFATAVVDRIPDRHDETRLAAAHQLDHCDEVQYLLDHRVGVTTTVTVTGRCSGSEDYIRDFRPIDLAAIQGNFKVFKLLYPHTPIPEDQADPNVPWRFAHTRPGNLRFIQFLVQSGVDVTTGRSTSRATMLHETAAWGDVDMSLFAASSVSQNLSPPAPGYWQVLRVMGATAADGTLIGSLVCYLIPLNPDLPGVTSPRVIEDQVTPDATNLWPVAPNAVGFVFLLCVTYSSDHFRKRTFHIVFALCVALVGMIILVTIDGLHNKGIAYFACFLMVMGSYIP
ncbi:hypothetical protein H2203_003860 [Taxawa tesnikishii (nom. ined.)]|nr:hypothetical protein H2203_003860 [Dothideales sp. JES 119]